MAITWSEARTKVRGDLWRTPSGIADDVCDRGLHTAILDIEGDRRWLWLENISTSIPLTVASNQILLPTDLSSLQQLGYRAPGATYMDPLTSIAISAARILAANVAGTSPTAYALAEGQAFLDATAPVGSTFELIYTARTPLELSVAVAAGDTNLTLQREQTCVIAGACAHIASTFLRNSTEAGRQAAVYERIMDRMRNTEDEARGDYNGGFAMPDTGYHDLAYGRTQ